MLSVFISAHLPSFMLLSIIADFSPHRPEFDSKAFHVRHVRNSGNGPGFSENLYRSSVSPHSTKLRIIHLSSISGINGLLVVAVPRRSVLTRFKKETKQISRT